MSRYRGRHREGLHPVSPWDVHLDALLVAAPESSPRTLRAIRAELDDRHRAAVRLFGEPTR